VSRVREADRLVVWDYAFDADRGERVRATKFEVTGEVELGQILEFIEIDEPASTGQCMCLGSPHFDFMRGPKVLASLSLHHGVRMRWQSEWPADAELTRASSFEVCGWLDQFLRVNKDEEVLELFRASSESRTRLAVWCLRILGCDNSSWELVDQLTHASAIAIKIMPFLGTRACGNALRRAVINDRDLDACYGSARMLFFYGGWEIFTKSALNDTLPTLIPAALRHPRQRNRQYVMWVLSQLPGGDEPLRWVLNGESTPHTVRPDEAVEPEGLMQSRGLAPNEPLEASDRAYAAWLLGDMHATSVRDTIEGLAVTAKGPDRKILEKALEALGH
jgi:hypothetical protein